MRLPRAKEQATRLRINAIQLPLALIGLAVLFIALPQMFSTHALAEPKAPQGSPFIVTTTDDHDDMVCDADCTLREALNAASAQAGADTIVFKVTGTINLTSALPDITDDLTLDGPGANALTIRRDAASNFRIFNVTATGTVSFSGLTVTNGRFTGNNDQGGGINNFGTGTVNINACTITANKATEAGGIGNRDGTTNITDSVISDNIAEVFEGGGVQNLNGTVNITRCTISGNRGQLGAGGLNNGTSGTLTVTDCTVRDNMGKGIHLPEGRGGGIKNNREGLLIVTGSTITNNRANVIGGGIHNDKDGTAYVINCTVTANSAEQGGGISNFGTGTLNVTNSTVVGNEAAVFQGGGLYNLTTGPFNVKSSIIALNTAHDPVPDVFRAFTSAGFNLVGKTDGSTGFTASTDLTGTIAAPLPPQVELDSGGKPVLKDNGGPTQTVALACGSPAIDKGTRIGLNGPLLIDQRGVGFPRTIDDPLTANAAGGDGTDIGAIELPVCNHPPVAQCKNIQVSAASNCQATIAPADIDNGSFDPDAGDGIASRALDQSGPFGLGPHAVTLTVTDTHGASSSCMATVTVRDLTPPQIVCPANIIAKAQPGSTCVVVNFAPPQAADNCTLMTLACTPPAGSCFPLGTTTVNCTATDTSGNSASCSFAVTTFDICLQDETNPALVFLGNSSTGDYRFCLGGITFSGRAKVTRQGVLFTFEHNAADRRLMAKDDEGVFRGTASLQAPPGTIRCTLTDRDTHNNSCLCQ